MCGIAALYSIAESRVDVERLTSMVESLRHRGDRSPRIKHFGRAGLACARLAIIGREAGSQPFSDPGGNVWVVFNGEIYNHGELRAELEQSGRTFLSDCDTEVIVQGYQQWGPQITRRLKGMYAFVVFDSTKQECLAARDPFGIKPLYYALSDQQKAFSSEIYPLVKNGFRQVSAVPPGGYIYNGQVSGRLLTPDLAAARMGFQEAKTQLRQLIQQSVRRLLDTDLNVAVFCSGGIDSSVILYEAAQVLRDRATAYCVGTKDGDDWQYAEKLAKELGVKFRLVPIERSQMVESIAETIKIIESFEPNHIRAGTASVALAKAVSEDGIKVALVGEGADELLGGYEEFPDAVRNHRPIAEVEALFRRFIGELHKTQLQRVDRTTMAFGIEARVPFLEDDLARFILSIPLDLKVHRTDDGGVIPKYILREAYRGLLPDFIVDRRKIPMGEGAGIGDNRPQGPFYEYANSVITDDNLSALAKKYHAFNIRNKEEAHYFSLFVQRFGALALSQSRPMTNMLKTT